MSIFSIAAVGIITAFCVIILKESRADIAMLVGIVGGAVILLSLTAYFTEIFTFMSKLAVFAGINDEVFKILIKIVVIGYVADFAAGIIEESGSKALSEKVVLGGKLLIFVVSLPIIKLLLQIVTELLK